ncbi:MAG TPA: hypothetical protein VFG19_06935 [Geobacteraceae bacterium]|nr:hypothetical protein [Geobacteraceae bacterium]
MGSAKKPIPALPGGVALSFCFLSVMMRENMRDADLECIPEDFDGKQARGTGLPETIVESGDSQLILSITPVSEPA